MNSIILHLCLRFVPTKDEEIKAMVDLKQLNYFMVCTDVGSFSEAAKILYTTQSNVSKAIKALEKSVGATLFVRQARGITLTAQGKHVYKYACKIMDEVGALKDFSRTGEVEWLNISCNPSSWFANRFVEFYNLHYEENIHCQIYNASVANIMKRVRDYKDDLGYVYVMDSQKAAFQYALTRNNLEFVPLIHVDAILYLGQKHPLYHKDSIDQTELRKLRFIQSYQDEFTENNFWTVKDGKGQILTQMDVAVVTNSDYIMERMLTNSRLANISGSYLSNDDNQVVTGEIPLVQEDSQVIFGYLKREGEVLGEAAQAFASYIESTLTEQSGYIKK